MAMGNGRQRRERRGKGGMEGTVGCKRKNTRLDEVFRKRRKSSRTPGAGQVDADKPAMKTRTTIQDVRQARKDTKRKYFASVQVDEETFSVGDNVYIILEDGFELVEEGDVCQICGKHEQDEEVLLECDRCSRGFHLHCLDPPLHSVPEDEWFCPTCSNNEEIDLKVQHYGQNTARMHFLNGKLAVCRIEALYQRQSDMTFWFTSRWYYLPEDTHTGRQKHHGAREIFISRHVDDNDVSSLVRSCKVYTPEKFRTCCHEDDDVYMCEYEYDPAWQRFRRYREDEEEWLAEEEYKPMAIMDISEDEDEDFKPLQECPGLMAARAKGRRASNAANVHRGRREGSNQGIGRRQNIKGLGTLQIPEAPRRAPKTVLEKARHTLTLAAVPKEMPCRGVERDAIRTFIRESVKMGSRCVGRSLYISGVPGTGKTATVLEVMRSLKAECEDDVIPKFQFVEINGLKLPSPGYAYTRLYEALTGQYLPPAQALELLEQRFSVLGSRGSSNVTVLLIDELDQLVTRNQSVLYNLFEWPHRQGARLCVISIANTMDLPERMLPRITSRLGFTRLGFSPYSQQQIQEIVRSRLQGTAAFRPEGIEYASRKVAAVSGDVRRALELCRRAAEVAETDLRDQDVLAAAPAHQGQQGGQGKKKQRKDAGIGSVGMKEIDTAIKEMFDASHMQLIKNASKQERIFLACACIEARKTGLPEVDMDGVYSRILSMCRLNSEEPLPFSQVSAAASRLGAVKLVHCTDGWRHRKRKVSLNIPPDDLVHALKADEEMPWIYQQLSSAVEKD
eukprot:scaffold776_cov347-Pavlova_lutheri.AAC.21